MIGVVALSAPTASRKRCARPRDRRRARPGDRYVLAGHPDGWGPQAYLDPSIPPYQITVAIDYGTLGSLL